MAAISKPDKATFSTAINNAELLRETGNDHHHIGHTVLYLAERTRMLEAIALAAEAYTRFGEDAQLHSKLIKALQDFEEYENETVADEPPLFGLNQN